MAKNQNVGISIAKDTWADISAKAKEMGTNPHRLAADAIRNILAPPPQTGNPSDSQKQV